jgi:hypothetical protein
MDFLLLDDDGRIRLEQFVESFLGVAKAAALRHYHQIFNDHRHGHLPPGKYQDDPPILNALACHSGQGQERAYRNGRQGAKENRRDSALTKAAFRWQVGDQPNTLPFGCFPILDSQRGPSP